MRGRKSLTLRGFAMILVAMGVMSMGATSVSAQTVTQGNCVNEPGLAFFDTNKDGLLDVAELQAVAASFPDDADLQALVQQASADPTFVIQFDGNCDGADTGTDTGADTGTDTGADTGADTGTDTGADTGTDTGTDTGADTGADTGTTPGNGDDDDDDNGGVSELPDTGTGAGNGQNGAGLLLVGVGGLLALVGAFALRLRGQA